MSASSSGSSASKCANDNSSIKNGVIDGATLKKKKRKQQQGMILAMESCLCALSPLTPPNTRAQTEIDARTTSRQKSVREAGKPSEHYKVDGMNRRIGDISQTNAAHHNRQGGMDKSTRKGHLSGGLVDPGKRRSTPKKKTGLHGLKR
jgi:hypothetical protein